jgi:hypothetical protein
MKALALQPRQPLPGILNIRKAGVGAFPKGEEVFMFDGYLFLDLEFLTSVDKTG